MAYSPTPAENDTHGDSRSHVERDEVSAGMLGIIGSFIAVVVILIVVLLEAWFYNSKEDLTAGRTIAATDPRTALGRARIEQQEQINSYRWINREAGVRAIPIGAAMELVAKDMAAQQSRSKK